MPDGALGILVGVPRRSIQQVADVEPAVRHIQDHKVAIQRPAKRRHRRGQIRATRSHGLRQGVGHEVVGIAQSAGRNEQFLSAVAVGRNGRREQVIDDGATVGRGAIAEHLVELLPNDGETPPRLSKHGPSALLRHRGKRLNPRRRIQGRLDRGPGRFHLLHIPVNQGFLIGNGRLRLIRRVHEQGILGHYGVSEKML